jgi:hypothetical protein
VHPRKKENNPHVESSLLKRLRQLLPPGCKPILVADAGFRGPWLKKVLAEGWDFVTRVRGRVSIRRDAKSRWRPAKRLWAELTPRPKSFGRCSLARYLPVEARLIGVWRNKAKRRSAAVARVGRRKKRAIKSAREPWLLATSLDDAAAAVVRTYATRMRIELTFRDEKCPRFGLGLDQVRTTKLARVRVYCLLAALAHYIALLVGAAAERESIHRAFQANTTVSRRVLSWARLGREVLERLEHQLTPHFDIPAQLPLIAAVHPIRGDP